ncbi:MAG: hypothetical protein FJ128_08480 [Deltaproteobacteria bacterium]|nr:hypothetical protein [Deltaproteobacteria bacterium]
MTKCNTHSLTCPKCSQAREVVLYDSINADHDPLLKEKLFKGGINMFQCEPCDVVALVNYPLLYHDMKRKFIVQYFPPDVLEDENFFKIFRKNGTLSVEGLPDGNYMKEPHLVFDMNEMLRYVVFRDNVFETGQA